MRFPRLLACLLAAALPLVACDKPQQPTITLYRAVQADDLDQIKRHAFWGTDFNQPGPDGDYPLHVAARRGGVVVVRELLDAGARTDVTDRAGRTPLHVSLAGGKTQVAQVLFDRAGRAAPVLAQELLQALVAEGIDDRDTLALLTTRGANVNAVDASGRAPLHVAAERGYHLLAKRLIDRGADVNLPDAQGRTPLAIARALRHRDVAAVLERFGAAVPDAPAR